MRRQKWQIGDVFVVKTADGKLVPGQVVGREPQVLNSASVAFFDERYDSVERLLSERILDRNRVFAVVFATRDLLDSGHWKVVGHREIAIPQRMQPYEHLRESGYVGAKVIGSGILNRFLDAFYGLAPWDEWKDPEYLDRLLVSPDKKPIDRLVYKDS